MDRVIQRLSRGVEEPGPESSRGNLGGAYFTHAALSFSTTEADNRICCDTPLIRAFSRPGVAFLPDANHAPEQITQDYVP
jgi:hypothetical protein